MKVAYAAATDILRILLNEAPIEESDEPSPGVILDYDAQGRPCPACCGKVLA